MQNQLLCRVSTENCQAVIQLLFHYINSIAITNKKSFLYTFGVQVSSLRIETHTQKRPNKNQPFKFKYFLDRCVFIEWNKT